MDTVKLYAAVIIIRFIFSGLHLISKAALNRGISTFVFVFYRQAAATVFLAPLAIIFERKRVPPLSFVVFFKMFMLALFGFTLSLDLYNVALDYTSATLGAASTNAVPVITFFLAVLLRMEMVNLRSLSGTAKVVGLLVCMAGAVTIGLYKGPRLKSLTHHHPMGISSTSKSAETHAHTSKTWIGGSFLMLTSNILWGFWLVLQVSVLKSYPSKLLFTTMQCLLSTIQSFFVAIAFERNPSQWKLSLDIGLLAILYSGVVATGVSTYLITWCIEKKGPVFLAIFTPLSLIITMVCSTFLFGEVITLGSVIGGVLLVGGLYSVLWGKRKDELNNKLVTEEKKDCPEEKEMA